MAKARNEGLTKREFDVLKRFFYSTAEIATDLQRKRTTIQTHINHVYDKLLVHNREQALIKALKTGIITIDEVITNEF